MSIAEKGELATTPLAELLIAVYRNRGTGRLTLSRARIQKTVVLADGAPACVESNVASERLASRLLASGRIDGPLAERLDSAIDEQGRNEAAALAALRIFDPKAVLEILRAQTRARLLPAFAWLNGSYSWKEGAVDATLRPLRVDPIRVVQLGVAGHWTPERILIDLAPLANQIASPNDSLPTLLRRLDRSGALDALLAGLRGEARFDMLLGRAARDPKALAGAWVLVRCGALAFHADSEEKPDDAFGDAPAEIEIAVVGAEANAAAATRDAERLAVRKREQATRGEALREEILARHASLRGASHYEILGVAEDAPAGAIKKAYFQAAKRLHPDKLGGLGLDDVLVQAGELIARINEASKVLNGAKSRQEYDRATRAGDAGQIDVARLAQAESFFVKGEVLFRMGDFRSALPLLQSAVDVWPQEAIYQSTLGWALFKKSPPDPKLAAEHLSKALQLEPASAQVHYWLGLVQKSLGQAREAADSLARARLIDPNFG